MNGFKPGYQTVVMANVKASTGGDDSGANAGGAAPGSLAATNASIATSGDKIVKTTPSSRAPNSTSSTAANESSSGAGVNTYGHTATTAGNYLGQKLKAAQVEGLGAGNELHSDVR